MRGGNATAQLVAQGEFRCNIALLRTVWLPTVWTAQFPGAGTLHLICHGESGYACSWLTLNPSRIAMQWILRVNQQNWNYRIFSFKLLKRL